MVHTKKIVDIFFQELHTQKRLSAQFFFNVQTLLFKSGHKKLNSAYKKLKSANKKLKSAYKKLKSPNQKLKSANQKLKSATKN